MASRTTTAVTATSTVPWLPRLLITSVEPVLATFGSLVLLISPETYNAGLTRESISTIDSGTKFVYTELAGAWLIIVFIELAILRLVDDLRVWKLLCISILLSDVLYTHSLAEAVGGWAEWVIVTNWTALDWVATITTWPFVLTRLAIVSGLFDKKQKTS